MSYQIQIHPDPSATKQVKGNFFEDLLRLIMEKQRYQVTKRINFTGTEIDLLCKHMDRTQDSALVECKARQSIVAADIKSFVYDILVMKRAEYGYFVHTSELHYQAAGMVEKHKELHPKKLIFWGPDKVIELLQDCELIAPYPKNLPINGVLTPIKRILLYTYLGRFWVTLLSDTVNPTNYHVADASSTGKEIDPDAIKWISEIEELKGLSQIESMKPPVIDVSPEIKSEPLGNEPPSIHQPWNVPFWHNPNFTGREKQLEELHRDLQPGENVNPGPVLEICGLGGTGKTQLAVEYAHKYKDDYPAGILWVRAENNILDEYGALGDELELKLHSQLELESRCQVVRRNLERWIDPGLLVLDNLDDRKDYEAIKKYLPTTGLCRILVTSRHKNIISSQGIELDVLSPQYALDLLLKESNRTNEGDDGERICRLMGNLPLALELAGVYLRKHKSRISMSHYADKLERTGVLEHRFQNRTDKLDHTDHIASLKATLAINEELLGDLKVQTVLAGLVCFAPENINYELLMKVSDLDDDDFLDCLSRLEEFSLVKDKNRRLCIHRLLREAIPDQLDTDTFLKAQKKFIFAFEAWSNICEDKGKIKNTTFEIPHLLEAVKLAKDKKLWPSSFDLAIRLGNYYGNIGQYTEKIKMISPFESSARENSDLIRLGLLLNHLGYTYDELGKHKEAIEFLEQALEIRKEAHGDKHPDVAESLNDLGHVWDTLGDHQKALELNEKALEIRKAAYGDKHFEVSKSLNNLGNVWDALGDHQKALELYEKALEITKEIHIEKHPHTATILSNLGCVWRILGKYQKAIKLSEKALDIRKKIYGEKHPDIANSLNNLGVVFKYHGNPQKAIELYEKALEINKEIYGEKHPNIACTLNNLGSAWDSRGNHQRAIGFYEQALEMDKEIYGEKHLNITNTLSNLGFAWNSLKDYQKAVNYYEENLEINEKFLGSDHPNTRRAKKELKHCSKRLKKKRIKIR